MIKKVIFVFLFCLVGLSMGSYQTQAAECTDISVNLSQGSSGAEVTKLQTFLKDGGYFSAESTGYFGTITEDAVRKFQSANGIDVVGTVGPLTRAKIRSLTCGGSASASATSGSAMVDVKINGSNTPAPLTGQTFTLSWKTQGVQSCTIGANDGGGAFPVDPENSFTYPFKGSYYPAKNTIYTVSCKDSTGKTVSDTVSINVNVPKALVDSLGYSSTPSTGSSKPSTPATPSTPSGQVALSTQCSSLAIGNPEANAPQAGFAWGPAYYSGNPRWREIEWRIQNGISVLASDLGQYYTEYYTAMGLPQHLTGLLRSDGTPFAGPGGIPVKSGATITYPTPGFNSTMKVFEYQPELGFLGSPQGATVEMWVTPFSSPDRVVCPLKTPLTGTVWSDPEPTFNPPASTKFSMGDLVSVTTSLNVRSSANGAILRTVNAGVQGTIIGGPTYAGGFHWWNVDFGNLGSGWSAENYLVKTQAVPSGGMRIRASYGGAGAVVTGQAQPSMAVSGALFGHDKNQQESPIVITFDTEVKNASFRVLYQDPNETFTVGSDNLLVSGTRIRAEYFSKDGSLLGTQTLGGSNLVGASSETTLPQGFIRVGSPIQSVKLYIPTEYDSAVFFSSGIEADS